MINSIRVDIDVPMEMRDSVILRADIYRPDDNQKHPAILIRTPYNKQVLLVDFLNAIDAARAGYAVIVQDIRGRWASDGEWKLDNMYTVEGPDGYDSVEWVASQPWCDGNVGMAGASYMAALQWITAMENPPHLKAIAPWIGQSSGEVAQSRTGGAAFLHVGASWIPLTALDVADRLEKQGKDVTEMRLAIYHAIFNPQEVYNFLPLKDVPIARFEGMREWWNQLLNPVPNADAAERTRYRYEKVMIPCFHISGWYDIFNWDTLENSKIMREKGGSQIARDGQHLLMGPWIHYGQLPGFQGDINFGPTAEPIGAQVSQWNLTFFDKYLRGRDVNLPMVRYFVMGRNWWYNADTWPLSQTEWQRFFLHSQGLANTAQGDGLLNRDEPGAEPNDIFVYNPHLPVPTVGGRSLALAGLVPGPVEQSFVERRGDVLCYTTAELKEEMEVTGPLEVHLFAATSARDTDFTARLVDVYPDGRAYNIAEGIIRARGRRSIFKPELVKPGEVNEYVINLGAISQLFREGHRIRIDISSSNFPMYDRNMNTGNPIGEDTEGIPAMQTIYHQSGYASYIDLPVIPTVSPR